MSICWDNLILAYRNYLSNKKALGAESESLRNKNEKSNMIECGPQSLYFGRRVDAMDR